MCKVKTKKYKEIRCFVFGGIVLGACDSDKSKWGRWGVIFHSFMCCVYIHIMFMLCAYVHFLPTSVKYVF